MAERFLSLREVTDMLGVTRVSIYNFMQRNNFPRGFKFGRSRRWSETEINEWMQSVAVKDKAGNA